MLPAIIINLSIPTPYLPFQIVNLLLIIWCAYRIFPFHYTPLSSDTITYLFIYIFLGIAPLYQFSKGISIWGGESIKAFDYFYVTLILIGAVLIYDIAYRITSGTIISQSNTLNKHYVFIKSKAFILCVISLIITLYAYRSYPILLIFREYNEDTRIVFDAFSNTSLNLIYIICIRPLPIVVLMYYNLMHQKQTFFSFLILFIALITNFPLSLPRFYVAGLYLPLLFTYFKSLIRKPLLIKYLFIIGILFIFPFLNQGRTVNSLSELEIGLIPDYDMFLTGHFDTFQNGLRVIRADFVTYGKQLLGVLLFWFPRSIWPGKPVGSGSVIADQFDLSFDHIALNYWAEGWINFGLPGTIIFSIILGVINAKLDIRFYKTRATLIYRIIYYIYIGMLFFILRGDLISCVAYMIGLAIVTYGCSKFIISKSR